MGTDGCVLVKAGGPSDGLSKTAQVVQPATKCSRLAAIGEGAPEKPVLDPACVHRRTPKRPWGPQAGPGDLVVVSHTQTQVHLRNTQGPFGVGVVQRVTDVSPTKWGMSRGTGCDLEGTAAQLL
jgi:hypothetical protein